MAPSWNPNDYSDVAVKNFVQELVNLVNEYSEYVYFDSGVTGLMMKDKKTNKKLMEYWPGKNKLINTKNNHEIANVSSDLSYSYHKAIDDIGPSITESNMAVFLDYLRKIIIQLNKLDSGDESNIAEKTFINENKENYLPVRQDFENAYRKCSRFFTEASEISIDKIFDTMEKDLLRKGFKLHKDWRTVTEKNIAFWAKTHDE